MSGKVLKSALIVGIAASIAALGASAGLAGASRGRVQTNRSANLLINGRTVQRAGAIAPGDRIERKVVLRVRGPGELRIVALTVKAKRASLLTSRNQGLRLSLSRCSRRWQTGPQTHSYTCRGRRTRLLASVRVLGRRKLGLILRPRARAYLRLTLKLPTRAGNALERQSSRLVFRFTAVERTRS